MDGKRRIGAEFINKGADMQDFLKTVQTRSDLLTAIVAPGSEGVSISVKR